MSFMLKNRPINEVNNKDREHFLSLKVTEDYSFKYIPESHFKRIVKNVQRYRRKEDEERVWASFVKERELNSLQFEKKDTDYSIQNMKDLLQGNMQNVDRELKRLEEDALPERSKGTQNPKSNIKNEVIYTKVNNIRRNHSKNRDTCKTNVPISQDDNISIRRESEGQKTVFKSKAKKSLSDSSITEKKYTNQLFCATNHFENNSDTDSSNNKDDIIHIQPDPLTVQKLLSMQTKIAELLDEISFRLCRIPLPDGENDLKKRQQQTLEFAIRFSRNYLYNLGRLVTSIQRHIRAMSSRLGLKQCHKNIVFHQDMIKQKLVAAHQLLIQALSAYCKHIPNSIFEGHSRKLQDVLQIVHNLINICDKVEISSYYFCSGDVTSLGKNLQDKCDAILSKLKLNLENNCESINHKNIQPVMTAALTSLPNKGRSNRKNLSNRLSMYSMDVKVSKGNQKRRHDIRRKNYTYRKEDGNDAKDIGNSYAQDYSVPDLLYPSPITRTTSSRDVFQIDSVKNINNMKDDDIRTMMDGLTMDSENDSNIEIQSKCKSATNSERQSVAIRKKTSTEMRKMKNIESNGVNVKIKNFTNEEDDLIKRVTAIPKEHLASLAPVINDLVTLVSKKQNEREVQPVLETSVEILRKFLQKYQSPKDCDTKASLTKTNCNGLSEINKHDENVQLICISSMDKVPKMTLCDASCQVDCETALKTIDDGKITDSNVKNEVQLIVSEKTELQFFTYRCEYKKFCQSRPMYSSNTQNKPWDIVAWISDKLIEELIIEITEELQMNDIITKLFELEFHEL
ncbi:hypothetical protein E2986_09976 [Frieseomelitta varia]|uniref:Uncharacterized protein n=2 Tax=Frieseomelitta varia TaxID=561572 RepID=A0A833RBJ9_9HYME|nr:uncharacterized protein LOC122530772 isoform X1 [Frieseomelitta varia]KAF3425869.1 hypothetical protein E2986_09976 [Frieseomelitta varia]